MVSFFVVPLMRIYRLCVRFGCVIYPLFLSFQPSNLESNFRWYPQLGRNFATLSVLADVPFWAASITTPFRDWSRRRVIFSSDVLSSAFFPFSPVFPDHFFGRVDLSFITPRTYFRRRRGRGDQVPPVSFFPSSRRLRVVFFSNSLFHLRPRRLRDGPNLCGRSHRRLSLLLDSRVCLL